MVLLYPEIHTEINPDTQTVVVAGEAQKVRPKTFQLLQRLIQANGELVSKETLLNEVWEDVVVDEQVIFQSVKELRKLFPGQTVIKTVPRKGYAWLPKPAPTETKPLNKNRVNKRTVFAGAAATIVAIVLFIAMGHGWSDTRRAPIAGSIVVLPVQSDISDHDWVRYGVMDQVISRLTSTDRAGVLQTDYVLDVMARAGLSPNSRDDSDMAAIFAVSGAELILAMQLTGAPNDYQLVYTLYQRDGMEKGVFLDHTVQSAADQVALLMGQRITPDFVLSQQDYRSSFTHRLIAEALEAKSAGNRTTALEMLEAARANAPENLVALRLLTQLLVESGTDHNKVAALAHPALQLAQQQQDTIAQIRLGFWLAVSESLNGQLTQGEQRFLTVENLARSVNDWLYLAYVEELRGKLQQQQQHFGNAQAHFQQAMQYHQILHCPLGQSNTLMHLSRLANVQQRPAQALENAEQALALIQSRKLSGKLPQAQQWLKQLQQHSNSKSTAATVQPEAH